MGLRKELSLTDKGGFRRSMIRNWKERDCQSDRLDRVSHYLSHKQRAQRKRDTRKLIEQSDMDD